MCPAPAAHGNGAFNRATLAFRFASSARFTIWVGSDLEGMPLP
ncbi:hypothetical protein LILAB_15520 [Corallococcus macrosporus]|uniref:Uncharacterized protein n=1 Tax=Myxococcus fulvus (strain ATCC BAA-855 / HW-1) TaxID=483219 RepID=F8CH90_MYXFH|nr:hypothetical protein LILAB_15520 [Corallococcus macrosporus]